MLEQVGVHTPHIRTGRRQGEGFLFCPLLLPSWFIWHTQNAMMWMLEQDQNLRQVTLCLDNDEAGIKASQRLSDAHRSASHGRKHPVPPG